MVAQTLEQLEVVELKDGLTVTFDRARLMLVDWPAVRQRLTELAYVPSDNVVLDNQRRLDAGLPMIRRGRWGK